MREILFKAKSISNGEWIIGSVDFSKQNIPGAVLIRNHNQDDWWISKQVDPESVCQYTGLKDRNGTMIFECDRIDYFDEGEYNCADMVVEWDDVSARFVKSISDDKSECRIKLQFDNLDSEYLEVIGNVHDDI